MLSIYFGEKDNVMHGPSWFKFNYNPEWFKDELVQQMIEDIDKSKVVSDQLIQSEVLGPIPPERLSGGVQTLISAYGRPDLVFNATSCGENCAKWLLKIGEVKDITVNLRYFMPFNDMEPFKIKILNNDIIVTNMDEYTDVALDYI
ncbi:MAG: DUF4869 domain-containing protein [Lachnospiraceae bacterium]|jgi:hypothetical protein|uniref:DUF4869 domain-containing protein n=1 Tax=Pseudobutyrivibrio sp. TaxID=2014367 RepID=UPI0025F8E37F|nr:DUF4869 domain-containing protein [Pseudobutyrivibrio sp.]MBQ5474224.1 DUF4869 domain-containing protein [Lachnospiraceae bacterium]MBQ8490566.1 DUF4869 domain-containing protein [Pseudobutyrivibrio sp.]